MYRSNGQSREHMSLYLWSTPEYLDVTGVCEPAANTVVVHAG